MNVQGNCEESRIRRLIRIGGKGALKAGMAVNEPMGEQQKREGGVFGEL